jgi:hypothetical protein
MTNEEFSKLFAEDPFDLFGCRHPFCNLMSLETTKAGSRSSRISRWGSFLPSEWLRRDPCNLQGNIRPVGPSVIMVLSFRTRTVVALVLGATPLLETSYTSCRQLLSELGPYLQCSLEFFLRPF